MAKQRIKLKDSVKWFSQHMENVLRDNDYKGGWEDIDVGWLLGRLQEEVCELENELHVSNNEEKIIKECCDVANFAMMIADLYENNYGK